MAYFPKIGFSDKNSTFKQHVRQIVDYISNLIK
jgi:hypothetical protein